MLRIGQQILDTVARHGMLRAGDRVGVAVSGGADSVALLFLLEHLRLRLGIRLLVLHFNHGIRGQESDEDEQFVAGLASRLSLEFIAQRQDVPQVARDHRWNLEDAARRLRYRFFTSTVESGRTTRVAVAHTADDQAETLLAHLMRGTGTAGLAAIYPVAGAIVRPLLEVRRHELRAFLSEREQSWREDTSNQDMGRLRARIRRLLLPQLESEFQTSIVERLCSLAALAREEENFWAALEEDRIRSLVRNSESGLTIRLSDLLDPLPLAVRARGEPSTGKRELGRELPGASLALSKRMVRKIVEQLKGDREGLTARHVDQVLYLATASTSGRRVELPGVVVERNLDKLCFRAAGRPGAATKQDKMQLHTPQFEYQVDPLPESATTVCVPEIKTRFRLKVIDWPLLRSETKGEATALDRDRLRAPLVFRNWRPGDSYQPSGRRRARKLKEMWRESRVAAEEKRRWPVLTSAGSLAWARGLPVAEEFAVRKGTRTAILISEEEL